MPPWRAFKVALAVFALSPTVTGLGVLVGGADAVGLAGAPASADSHWRFFGGVWLAAGLAVLVTLRNVDRRPGVFRAVAGGAVLGGVGRLVSIAAVGPPESAWVWLALGLELVATPLAVVWHARLSRTGPPPAAR